MHHFKGMAPCQAAAQDFSNASPENLPEDNIDRNQFFGKPKLFCCSANHFGWDTIDLSQCGA
jgi:hypothetical protein